MAIQAPQLGPMPNQQGNAMPDVTRTYRGWYPRWWILSAYFCSLVVAAGSLLWYSPSCLIQGAFHFLCNYQTWESPLVAIPIWLTFLLVWFFALALGMGPIEMTPLDQMNPLARFFRAMSQFESVRALLFIYGAVAFCAIMAMWLLPPNLPQPVPHPIAFAIASIVVFIANCALFQRLAPRDRRMYLIAYGVLALIGAIFMLVIGRYDWDLLGAQVVLVLAGMWAIFLYRPQPLQNLTNQQILVQGYSQAGTPLFIMRSFWPFNRLFPNRPLRNANNNQNNQNNPGPGGP